MTQIYFVRHSQPDYKWKDDITRPLTEEGIKDSKKVNEKLLLINLDFVISSPYKRTIDTIKECANYHNIKIITDKRLRERESGENGNNFEQFRKRWSDFDYHEQGGECLRAVQNRNMEALFEVLDNHKNEKILLGTHGTALSTILNYYDKEYNVNDYLKMIDFMPYIIRLDFNGRECIGKNEILIIKKEYKKL